jgi:hypothetical protein
VEIERQNMEETMRKERSLVGLLHAYNEIKDILKKGIYADVHNREQGEVYDGGKWAIRG